MNAHGKPVVGSICPLPAGRRPRVLFLTRKWPPAVGGMEVYCRELVGELEKRTDLEVRALPGRPGGRPPSLAALLGFGLAQAARLIARPPPADIVHGGDLAVWPLVWIATWRNPAAGRVVSAHGTDIALAMRRGVIARLYRLYLKLGVGLMPSARILANSGATAKLCRGIGFEDVRVIRLATRMSGSAAALGAPRPYLLFAGRLIRSKGCAWFIEKVLPKLDPGLRLVVAGVVWDRTEAAALDDPRVDFRGPVHGKALTELRRTALAVIVPNIDMGTEAFEGFGLAATEAAAAGGIVLAADIYGVSDAVIDRQTGFLLPAGDAKAWAHKITEIRGWGAVERKAFLSGVRESVTNAYSWTRVADQTALAYEAVNERDMRMRKGRGA